MLKKFLILTTLTTSLMLSLAEFFWFKKIISIAFALHNILSLIVGLILIYLAVIFYKKELNTKRFNFIVLIIGMAMTIVHITKLFIGFFNLFIIFLILHS